MAVAGKAKLTKITILRAAYELASKKGLRAVTVRAVAAKAETSVGLIYYHYKNVPQIFRTILMHHYQRILDYLDALPAISHDPLLRYMAAVTMNIQFTASRRVFRNISKEVSFSGISKDSQYFALVKQSFETVQEKMDLDRVAMPLDAVVFAFIGAFEAVKSAYYRSMISPTPYELTRALFLQAFGPMGLEAKEIDARLPEIESICRTAKHLDIVVPWLSSVHDDAPEFNQMTLHELGAHPF